MDLIAMAHSVGYVVIWNDSEKDVSESDEKVVLETNDGLYYTEPMTQDEARAVLQEYRYQDGLDERPRVQGSYTQDSPFSD